MLDEAVKMLDNGCVRFEGETLQPEQVVDLLFKLWSNCHHDTDNRRLQSLLTAIAKGDK